MASTNDTVVLPSLDGIPLSAVRLWPELTSFYWRREFALDREDLWFVSALLRLWIGDDDDLFAGRLADLALRRAVALG
jgi:hypothetical protein